MKNYKSNINRLAELVIVTLFSSSLVLFMVVGLRTMFSGWHLVDDHQFLWYITRMNDGESIWSIIWSEQVRDYTTQFRARLLFYPFRVIQAALFGLNTTLYYILKAVEAILTLIFLYYSGKELRLNRFASTLFALASFCGPQSAVWWKLGTPQLQTTLFFSIGFYLMLRYFKTDSKAFAFLSLFSYLFMINFHESFLCLLPFVILFSVYYAFKESDSYESFSLSLLWTMVKKRLWYEIVLTVFFVALMVYIIFFLGVNNYGSVEIGYPIRDALDNLIASLHGDLKLYWYFGIVLLIILATFFDSIKKMWMEAILLFSIIIPQLLLYQKEGFYERYLLPIVFAWTFLFIVIPFGYNIMAGRKRRIIYSLILCLMVLLSIRTVATDADYFRFRGESVKATLNEMLELRQQGLDVVSTLPATNPEAEATTQFWLSSHDVSDCMYWNWEASEVVGNPDYDITTADMIIEYNRDDIHFRADMDNIDHSSFEYVKCGSLDLYFSKAVYNSFSEEDLAKFKIKPTIYGIGTYEYN